MAGEDLLARHLWSRLRRRGWTNQLRIQGLRATPSQTYLERTPRFSVLLDTTIDPDERRLPKAVRPKADSTQQGAAGPVNSMYALLKSRQVVPVGGMDWDGRAAVLADEAGRAEGCGEGRLLRDVQDSDAAKRGDAASVFP